MKCFIGTYSGWLFKSPNHSTGVEVQKVIGIALVTQIFPEWIMRECQATEGLKSDCLECLIGVDAYGSTVSTIKMMVEGWIDVDVMLICYIRLALGYSSLSYLLWDILRLGILFWWATFLATFTILGCRFFCYFFLYTAVYIKIGSSALWKHLRLYCLTDYLIVLR